MADKIEPGSIVQLKSGGPAMTVNWVEDEQETLYASCDWFIQDMAPWKKETATFPVTSLKMFER